MASGLRMKAPKNYRSILGLKPVAPRKTVRGRQPKVIPMPVEQHEDIVDYEVDMEAERNLFGSQEAVVSEDELDDLEDLDEDDLDTEQILALAEEEEA